MGIFAYQIDNIIKTYSKQSRLQIRFNAKSAPPSDKYSDVVTLSGNQVLTAETYNKISYNLMDILLKDNKKTSP